MMTNTPQHATSVSAWERVVLRGCALGLALLLAAPADAAVATRVRSGHVRRTSAQTEEGTVAGGAAARSEAKGRGGKRAATGKAKKSGETAAAKNSKMSGKKQAAPAKGRRGRRAPEVVDEPVLMHRADGRHAARRGQEQVAARWAAGSAAKVEAADEVAGEDKPAAKKTLTVEDFLRAAQGSAPEVADRGVSHPDEDSIETTDAPVVKAKTAAVAPKPVPAAVKTPAVKQPLAQVSANGVSFEDAPEVADVPQGSRVVQGFGGEVGLLPSTNKPAKRAMAVKDVSAEERREITDDAVKPTVVPLYTRGGRLIVPPPLKGTREILVHQNVMADNAGLTRIQDDEDLNHMRAQHLLVPFPDIASLEVNDELPVNRRYARPWTVKFASDTARAFYARFHEPLRLNSAVRTVDYQVRLRRVNGNAAAIDGDAASPHLTGQAIDFGKRGMSVAQIAWMRTYLLPLMQAGKVDVEEEFQQSCFHISVYGSYAPSKRAAPKTELAQVHGQ